ncbi:acyl dehydratase [Bordetella genomosp. 10]|uniref:Acyl dehydratase n=1 Tax=Bordetella genomosp. 10 TaxID=1416804 RepID=A0A261S1Z2_9BORD|nr:MaoC family dehydratase [Bordetella genomosp. 10]OZI31356.1 acyl dehydratase [Bordetella genomosp. 10]
MKFAEFKQGMVIKGGPVTVTEAEILAFARQYDPQWFHADPARAAEGRWGGLIASGWHTCALAMRMAVDAALHDSESFGSPGLGEVRWRVPVRPGDQLRLEARVQAVRTSSSRPDLGITSWTWVVLNQHGESVLELDATILFDLSEDKSG